jgi:transcriptional regulator with XRE-family HTH domain
MTYRPVDAKDWIARQPEALQAAGEARAEDIIRKVTLRAVRAAVGRTQVEVAAAMGTSQDRVSKFEHGEDALVSTLRRHIRALGGELRLVVEFPGRPSMTIDLQGDKPVASSTRASIQFKTGARLDSNEQT